MLSPDCFKQSDADTLSLPFLLNNPQREKAKSPRGLSYLLKPPETPENPQNLRVRSAGAGSPRIVTRQRGGSVAEEQTRQIGSLLAHSNTALSPSPESLPCSNNCSAHACHHSLFRELTSIVNKYPIDGDRSHKIIEFAQELIYQDESYQLNAKTSQCKLSIILGKILFLYEHKPNVLFEAIEKASSEESLTSIDNAFRNAIKKVHKQVDSLYKSQMQTGLQNAEVVRQIAFPTEIAHLIVLSTGAVNFTIIPEIIDEFIENSKEVNNFSAGLKTGLQLLWNSASLREKIASIRLNSPPSASALTVIRAALHIPFEQPVSDTDAKICAVSALLTHLRQSKSGSCFATFIAIELQSIAPLQCIDDFLHLLQKGFLERNVDETKRTFPYLLSQSCEDLFKNITLNSSGHIRDAKNGDVCIWEDPGIKLVCTQLQIKDPQTFFLNWLQAQTIPPNGLTITIDRLLTELCLLNQQAPIEEVRFIYSSMTSHPLLRAWENSLAGMAEGKRSGLLQTALEQTIQYFFEKKAERMKLLDVYQSEDIRAKLSKELSLRVRYLYDPAYVLTGRSDCSGAFVLFDSKGKDDSTTWTKIDSATTFQALIPSLIDSILPEDSKLKRGLYTVFASDKSLSKALKKYHRENELGNTRKKDLSKLRFTPWVTLIGNDPKMVFRVYLESEIPFNITEIRPSNAKDLLNTLIEKYTNLPETIKKRNLREQSRLTPVRIPGMHSFSLLAGHASLRPIYKSGFVKKTWIEEKILKEGFFISSLPMTSAYKQRLIDYVADKLINKSDAEAFRKKIAAQTETIKFKKFRNTLFACVQEFLDEDEKNEWQRRIDLKMIQALPAPIREAWEDSIVHIADSNWQVSVNDVHYGIGINPSTGDLELFSVLDNGKIFDFLDQEQFFGRRVWELCTDL